MASVIIPAHNESRGIARVINTVLASPLVGEVIVVDDSSSDNTAAIARRLGARVIRHPKNKGKGQAMQTGVQAAQYDTLLFCDGDMYGFSQLGIAKIVSPVGEGKVDMAIGVRPIISMTHSVFPFLMQFSGLRAIKKGGGLKSPKPSFPVTR